MVKANFEYEGDSGILYLTTHFGRDVEIACEKQEGQLFRLGGTAVNDVVTYEGILLNIPQMPSLARFKAFRTPDDTFEGKGVLSLESWHEADRHCYITEYYPLDMEGKIPGWFISKNRIPDANRLFVNVDVLDGGGNVVKRYRVSPFTGDYIVREGL